VRAVVQRVSRASVSVDGRVAGEIGRGLAVLLGVGEGDGPEDARYVADKIANLRVFPDDRGKMNVSALDSGADVLVVPQFTLYGDCRKGRRPSFAAAAPPDRGQALYEAVVAEIRESGLRVETGEFGEHMTVEMINDGPVTLLLDSARTF